MKIIERPETTKTLFPSSDERASLRDARRSSKAPITMRELLVWAYKHQKAHHGAGEGAGGIGHASISATGVVVERLRLGCSVSGGGGLRPSQTPDDAMTVHSAVLRATAGNSRLTALVIHHAATDSEPEWSPAIPPYRCVPVAGRKCKSLDNGLYGADGALQGYYRPIFKYAGGNGPDIGCEVDYAGFTVERARAAIEHARGVYQSWYEALLDVMLAVLDGGRLKRWRVVDVGAAARPWA